MRPYWSILLQDGTEFPLLKEQGITVEEVNGAGMPPITNTVDEYAVLDGGSWQRMKAQARVITFMLTIHAQGHRAEYYAFRRALIESINPHRLCLPITLRWYGYDGTRDTNVYYDGGLEGSGTGGGSEKVPLRLLCPDPYFVGTEEAEAVDYEDAFTPEYVYSTLGGLWDTMGGGANNVVYGLAADPDGGVYAVGSFTVIGGVAANRIAYWNGTSWSALGAGLDNIAYAVAVAPNGHVYVGGGFLNAGGAPAVRAAYWDGAAWNAMGAGCDDVVRAIAIRADMTEIFYGGDFLNAGGAGANRVASWDPTGAAWSPLGVGVDDDVFALALGLDNLLYVGGPFLNAGGAGANRIASWDGAAWAPLRTGLDAAVNVLTVDRATGILYAGGAFTTADGIAALAIARWNEVAWAPMDLGLWHIGVAGTVDSLLVLSSGYLLAGGWFSLAGARAISARGLALWNGYSWVHVGLIIAAGGFPTSNALAEDMLTNRWYIGGNLTAVARTINGSTTVTNPGNANSYPVVTFERTAGGLCTVLLLKNETTEQTLWFDLDLFTGDILTVDTRPGQKRCYTRYLGGAIGDNPLPGSALANWHLAPGDNVISCLVDDNGAAGMTVTLTWEPYHWSID